MKEGRKAGGVGMSELSPLIFLLELSGGRCLLLGEVVQENLMEKKTT